MLNFVSTLFIVGLMMLGSACPALGSSSGVRPTYAASGQKEETKVQDWSKFIDSTRAAKVPVVLRVKLISTSGADKYQWDKVEILAVLKNDSKQQFGKSLEVAHYSWEQGIPKGESTIYLEPYSDAADHPWKLLGGSAKMGVTHPKSEP